MFKEPNNSTQSMDHKLAISGQRAYIVSYRTFECFNKYFWDYNNWTW